MIRIAIVEDDDSYIRALTGYLEQHGEQHSLSFHTSIFHDGLDIVTDYKADYDIILMDIQMKHDDRRKNPKAGRRRVFYFYYIHRFVCRTGISCGCSWICGQTGILPCLFSDSWKSN